MRSGTQRTLIFTSLLFLALCFLTRSLAHAQTFNDPVEQPTETISATPLSSFSERAALWPVDELSDEAVAKDTYSNAYRLNSVPGVQGRSEGSPTISIRGSAQADRVLKLYEGIPLNLADGIGASDLFTPSEVIGSERLIKGPASVFYGTSAVGGALDQRLRIFDRRAVRIDAADDGGQLGPRSAMLALPFESKFGLEQGQVTFFHERNPGQFPYTSVSNGTSGRRQNDAQDLTRMTGFAEKKIGLWQTRADFIAARSVGESPGSITSPFSETLDSSGLLTALSAERTYNGHDTLGLRLADTRVWGLFDRDTPTVSTTSASRTSFSADTQNAITDRLIARSFIDLSGDHLLASYAGGTQFNENNADVGQSYNLALTPTLSLQPSYRYRTQAHEWIKSLGLFSNDEFSETKHLRSWITYAEGFRQPALSDRYADAPDFKGNASLTPERSRSYEIGASFENGKRFSGILEGTAVKAAVYSTTYSDFIETSQISNTVITKINSGAARVDGFETSFDYGIHVWNFELGYNYMDARNETSHQPLRLSPQHQILAAISQQIGPIVVELRETFWSSFYDFVSSQPRELPAWNTTDLELRSMGFANWEVRAGCLNLFDRPREFTIGYPEPQRRFFASALRYF